MSAAKPTGILFVSIESGGFSRGEMKKNQAYITLHFYVGDESGSCPSPGLRISGDSIIVGAVSLTTLWYY